MFEQRFQRPTLWRLLLGLVLAGLICLAFLRLPVVVKLLGAPFLIVPEQLGLVRVVQRDEVQPLAPQGVTVVSLPRAGTYAIYAANYRLLPDERYDRPASFPLESWHVGPVVDGQLPAADYSGPWPGGPEIALQPVKRGLRPYDTYHTAGYPRRVFQVEAPGEVWFWANGALDTSIAIVPDYTTGHETTLLVCYLAQLGVLVLVAFVGLRVRGRKRRVWRRQQVVAKADRIAKAASFWEQERQRATGGNTVSADTHSPNRGAIDQ